MAKANIGQAAPGASSRPSRAAGLFILRFLVLLACFYAITATPWFQKSFLPNSLDFSARAASLMLNILGEQTHVVGASIVSPRFALSVFRGCDGVDPAALFIAAVLAFQVSWRSRTLGLLLGVPFLFIANEFRIISLYYIGAIKPEFFALAHIDLWQPLFVIVVALTWIAWAKHSLRSPSPTTADAHR